jgi:hypothetical protein
VVTFFHEFGHVLHHLLTRSELASYAGTNTVRDFVEAPSQMFEEWPWSREVLDIFASAPPDRREDPRRALRRDAEGAHLRPRARDAAAAGLRDARLEYHSRAPGFDTTALVEEVQAANDSFAFVKGTHFQSSFGHLIGYDAGYYSYQWALSLSRDVLTRFKKEGLLNPVTAGVARRGALQGRRRGRADDDHHGSSGARRTTTPTSPTSRASSSQAACRRRCFELKASTPRVSSNDRRTSAHGWMATPISSRSACSSSETVNAIRSASFSSGPTRPSGSLWSAPDATSRSPQSSNPARAAQRSTAATQPAMFARRPAASKAVDRALELAALTVVEARGELRRSAPSPRRARARAPGSSGITSFTAARKHTESSSIDG